LEVQIHWRIQKQYWGFLEHSSKWIWIKQISELVPRFENLKFQKSLLLLHIFNLKTIKSKKTNLKLSELHPTTKKKLKK